jgi:hypothetical protein
MNVRYSIRALRAAVSAHGDAVDVHETVPSTGSVLSTSGVCLGKAARRRSTERTRLSEMHPSGWSKNPTLAE